MLLAKISPNAVFTQQESPFQSTSVEAHHVTALARPYQLGGAQTHFEVVFGNLIPEVAAVEASEGVEAVQGQPATFVQVSTSRVELTSEELASWGTDDKVVLEALATKLGTSCTEFTTL
jgi:hypothetical protein